MLRTSLLRRSGRASRVRASAARLLRRLLGPEDGQAVVELALALPILLVVVLGIVDFGKAVNYWNDENHIANVTARYAAVGHLPEFGECGKLATPAAFAECEAKIDSPELLAGSGRTTGTQGKLGVCVSIPQAKVGEPVEVKITTSYSWLKLPKVLGASFKFASTNLSGTATMRLEQVPPSGFATTTGKC
jgi:Flp pilus assembly protein TadG